MLLATYFYLCIYIYIYIYIYIIMKVYFFENTMVFCEKWPY